MNSTDTLIEQLASRSVDSRDEKYVSLQEAQNSGAYPQWLATQMRLEDESPHIHRDIAAELDVLKELRPDQRLEEFQWIGGYYSRSNQNFEPTSVKLDEAIGLSKEEIEKGTYQSTWIAQALLERLKTYDREIVVPIITQIRTSLEKNFPNTNLLFLGRDFCSVYLYIVEEGILDRDNLFMANVSRYVRDVALGGKFNELRAALEQIGLTKERLLEKGLLVVDSCMKGKIPAAILKSLALGMDEHEAYRFLTHSGVRYLKSSRKEGTPIAEMAAKTGVDGRLTRKHVQLLLEELEMIEEFKIDYPTEVAEHVPRRHKLFEWRPKVACVAMGIDVDPSSGRVFLVSDDPKTPSEKILSLLGMYADMQLAKHAAQRRPLLVPGGPGTNGHAGIPLFSGTTSRTFGNPEKMALEVGLLDHSVRVPTATRIPTKSGREWVYKEEIDQAARGGIEGLKRWQERVDPSEVGSIAVLRTAGNIDLPFELIVNGKSVRRIRELVGEGNNIKAYVSDRGTVLKVIKNTKYVRKNLLSVWAQDIIRPYGIRIARILETHPTGLYIEQEAVLGPSLEQLYGETEDVPENICIQALYHFRKAKELVQDKGIWLDLKSANYQIADGVIVNVDFTPRLNSTHYRYFKGDDGHDLSDDEFLDLFFHYDARKRKLGQRRERT